MRFDQLKDEYAQLWASMVIRSSFKPALEASAKKIIANKDRYASVSEMTKVPWYVIGLIHQMEAGGDFSCHLHNGDSLAERTIHVPKNRPVTGNGPFRWESSACDAIVFDGLHKVKDWTIERICYQLESFNGWGYRKFHQSTLTPYLWSGTTHYARGKYVEDNRWDASAVSGQSGAIALLKTLMALDETIKPGVVEVEAAPLAPQETVSDSFVKADGRASEKGMGLKEAVAKVAIPGAIVVEVAKEAAPALPVPAVPEVVTQSISNVQLWKGIGEQAWQLKTFALAQPILATIVGISVLAVMFWPKRNQP